MQLLPLLTVLLLLPISRAVVDDTRTLQPPVPLPEYIPTGELALVRTAASIEATSECGVDATGGPDAILAEFCTAESCKDCTGGRYPARAAIDGNATTNWVSRPGETEAVLVTLHLGQPFHLSGLTLTSGPSPLPASWTVHISENGTSFVPLVAFYSDDPSDCPGISSGDVMGEMVDILRVLEEELEVQCEEAPEGHTVPITLDDISFGEEGFPLVTSLQLELKVPRAVDDPMDPRQLYFSLAELTVFGHCPPNVSFEDCPIVFEPGCGFCVAQLINALRTIHQLITTALRQIPEVEIDPVTIENLEEAIERLKAAVAHLEGTFLTLSVVYGSTPPLPLDVVLPDTVERLDLLLVPSIIEKLENIRAQLERLPEFTLNTSAVSQLLDGLQEPLNSTIANATELSRLVEILLSRSDSLLSNVTHALNFTRQSRIFANEALLTILNRVFVELVNDLGLSAAEASRFLSLAQYLFERASENHRNSEEVRRSAEELETLLRLVVQLLMGVLENSRQAISDSTVARNITGNVRSLLDVAAELNETVSSAIRELELTVKSGENFLQLASNSTMTTIVLTDSSLRPLVSTLSQNVTLYRSQLSPYLVPVDCAEAPPTEPCTPGQKHADMLMRDVEQMISDSEPTLTLAEEFLKNLNIGQLFDYEELNRKALSAQNISWEALRKLMTANTSLLLNDTEATSVRTESLHEQSQELRNITKDLLSEVSATAGRTDTLQQTFSNVSERAAQVDALVRSLDDFSGLSDAAIVVAARARNASSLAMIALERVDGLEQRSVNISANINQTRENIREAGLLLDDTESRFESIAQLLNETRVQVQQLKVDTQTFIGENNDIISEIDSLIANLGDVHSNVNRINSPIRLTGDEPIPYVSLQPPPGRGLEDTIQFESLDIYLTRGVDYVEPAVLFYAGPVFFDDEITNSTEEDYIFITAEAEGIVVSWEIGESSGRVSSPSRIGSGSSQIFVTRVGSQFEVLFGAVELGSPVGVAVVENNSLLFQTSEKTAFLLGGWPSNAQLGSPSMPIALEAYQAFDGQFQLLLFNGIQWGLWNIRSSSAMETDFIGDKEFLRNTLVGGSVWHGPRSISSSASTLSFDGNGYLKPKQFGSSTLFAAGENLMRLRLFLRPNDETDALVMFVYDREDNLSMEVALKDGDLYIKIRRHELPPESALIVNYRESPPETVLVQREWPVVILFSIRPGSQEFSINDNRITTGGQGRFFRNFVRTEAWFGGVIEEMLESPFIPEVSNGSYYGCLDFYFESRRDLDEPLVNPFFGNNYLSSPTQRGFSATCLTTIYAREVSLQGEGHLAYRHLAVVSKPNEGVVERLTLDQVVFSLTFFPQSRSGVILAVIDEDKRVYCVMRDGVLEVGVERGSDTPIILSGGTEITMATWQYLLISIELPVTSNGLGEFSFYLDGILQDVQSGFEGFTFQPPLGPPTPGPVLYVGGINETVFPHIADAGRFVGCLRDFAYNFAAVAFLNPQLEQRYPPGVSYNTCPYSNVSNIPILPVREEQAQAEVCLAAPPTELEGTHGGFHQSSQLLTGNVLGLWNSSWNISMQLKSSGSGHVLTIGSLEGHRITLSIETTRTARLSIYRPGSPDAAVATELQIEQDRFSETAISCSVDGVNLTCSLTVGGVSSEPLSVPYGRPIFAPSVPLLFGRVGTDSELIRSFVGCIRALAVSGDSSGFRNVRTNIPCYNNTEDGIGFSGTSRIASAVNSSVALRFKPRRGNGLLLLLHDHSEQLMLGVGLFNGELRISNFTGDYVAIANSSFCNQSSNIFHNLSIQLDQNNVSVVVSLEGGEAEQVDLQLTATADPIVASIGNVPDDLDIPSSSQLFQFLLSQDVAADELPPGFAGCVRDVRVEGRTVTVESADVAERLLPGFCPTSG